MVRGRGMETSLSSRDIMGRKAPDKCVSMLKLAKGKSYKSSGVQSLSPVSTKAECDLLDYPWWVCTRIRMTPGHYVDDGRMVFVDGHSHACPRGRRLMRLLDLTKVFDP
jgi:hypothetical protein